MIKTVKKVFDFGFEAFGQELVMMKDCILYIFLGNNKIKCQNVLKCKRFWFGVFDQKLVMMNDDCDFFLHFMLKCWHG